MRTSRALAKQIVATYAEALFEAATAARNVDAVAGQLADVVRTVRAHVELRDALLGEAVPAATRSSIVREVFSAYDPALVALLGVMAERGNFDLLSSVTDAYVAIAEDRRGTVAIEVTTVVELTDELRTAIKTKYATDLGREVVLHEKVDQAIVGGIVISTGGRTLDASLASQLEAARVALSTAHTGGDV